MKKKLQNMQDIRALASTPSNNYDNIDIDSYLNVQ
jgi:hypothetical protein